MIQEILLAPDFRLQCGPNIIDKAYLRVLFQQIEKEEMLETISSCESFQAEQSWDICWPLFLERQTLQIKMKNSMALSLIMDPRFAGEESHLTGNATRSILQLCSIYRNAKCEDQRDKIFGLLGIASSCCSRAIQVDYSSTLPELAQAVLLHHIHEHQDGALEALEGYIDFHHSLAITPVDYKPPPRSPSHNPRVKGELRANPRIITSAKLVDCESLVYISPPLDGSVQLKSCQIPALPLTLHCGLWGILDTEGSTWMYRKSLGSRITMRLDLVFPLDHATDCEVVFESVTPKSPPETPYHDDPPLFRILLLECQAALARIKDWQSVDPG